MRTYHYNYNGKKRTYTVYTDYDKRLYRRYKRAYKRKTTGLERGGYQLTEAGKEVYSMREFMTAYIGARNDIKRERKKLPKGTKRKKVNIVNMVLQNQISFTSSASARSIIEYYGVDELAREFKTRNEILLTYKIMHDAKIGADFREELKDIYDDLMKKSGMFVHDGKNWVRKDGITAEQAKKERETIYNTINDIAQEGSK